MDGNIGKYNKFSVILKIKYFVRIMSWILHFTQIISFCPYKNSVRWEYNQYAHFMHKEAELKEDEWNENLSSCSCSGRGYYTVSAQMHSFSACVKQHKGGME